MKKTPSEINESIRPAGALDAAGNQRPGPVPGVRRRRHKAVHLQRLEHGAGLPGVPLHQWQRVLLQQLLVQLPHLHIEPHSPLAGSVLLGGPSLAIPRLQSAYVIATCSCFLHVDKVSRAGNPMDINRCTYVPRYITSIYRSDIVEVLIIQDQLTAQCLGRSQIKTADNIGSKRGHSIKDGVFVAIPLAARFEAARERAPCRWQAASERLLELVSGAPTLPEAPPAAVAALLNKPSRQQLR